MVDACMSNQQTTFSLASQPAGRKSRITVEFDHRQSSKSAVLPYMLYGGLYIFCASTQQLRTLVIIQSDWAGEETSRKKNRYKFFVQRPDGKYLFRVSL